MTVRAPPKQRADQLLVDRGLVESRTRAQALILAGKVFSGEARIELQYVTSTANWLGRAGVTLGLALLVGIMAGPWLRHRLRRRMTNRIPEMASRACPLLPR